MQREWLKLIALPIALVGLLEHLARTLRWQSPWNCFGLTLDENYFLQVFINSWNGLGFRRGFGQEVFHPYTTVGPPLGWLGGIGQALTGVSWPLATRVGVYSLFFVLLGMLAVQVWRSKRSPGGIVVALAVFGWLFNSFPQSGYTVYGILGETPGWVSAVCTLWAFGERRWILAGLLAVFTFFVKPSYVFLPAALVIAESLRSRRVPWRLVLTCGGAALVFVLWVSILRGESVVQYAQVYLGLASKAALNRYADSLWVSYAKWSATSFVWLLVLCLMATWTVVRAFQKKVESAGDLRILSAAVFALLGVLLYVFKGSHPMPKHWLVFWSPMIFMTAAALGERGGPLLDRFFGAQRTAACFGGMALVWMIYVPIAARAEFHRAPLDRCELKEQAHLNERAKNALSAGKFQVEELRSVVRPASESFYFGLGHLVSETLEWKDVNLNSPTGRVVGVIESRQTEQWPLDPRLGSRAGRTCRVTWSGSVWSEFECIQSSTRKSSELSSGKEPG